MVIAVPRSAQRSLRSVVATLSLLVSLATQVVLSSSASAATGESSIPRSGSVEESPPTSCWMDQRRRRRGRCPAARREDRGRRDIVLRCVWGGPGQNFTLARYDPDGSLDPSFGTGGMVASEVGGTISRGRALALQPDGKIVVVGYTWIGLGLNYWDFGLARYNPDGSLDVTFGTDGVVTTDFVGGFDAAEEVVLQPDGRIVVVGSAELIPGNFVSRDFAVARYNTNGSLDTTFGNGGKVTSPLGEIDSASSVVVQPDGKIVAGGGGALTIDFALVRYNTDGTLDPTFGSGGMVTTDLGGSDYAALALQPDGRIVAAGSASFAPATWIFSLARYT